MSPAAPNRASSHEPSRTLVARTAWPTGSAGRSTEPIQLALPLLPRQSTNRGGTPRRVAGMPGALAISLLQSMGGRCAAALASLDQVMAQPALPVEVRAQCECGRLLAGLVAGDVEATRKHAEEVLAGDHRPDDDMALGGALTALGLIAWEHGLADESLGLLGAAVSRTQRARSEPRFLRPRLEFADKCVALGEHDEADAVITRAAWEITVTGDTVWSAAAMLARARLDVATGDLEGALHNADAAQDLAQQAGASILVAAARWVRAAVAVRRGDMAEAERHIAWRRSVTPTADWRLDRGAWTPLEAHVEGVRGGPTAAIRALTEVYRAPYAHRGLLLSHPGATGLLVRTALAVADRDAAEAAAASAQQMAAHNPTSSVIGAAADHADGLLLGSIDLVVQAARDHHDPWASGSAYEDAGAMASGRNDAHAAQALLASAASAYQQAGAIRDVRRVNAARRKVRATRHAHRKPMPLSGWASLTAAERRVADVVAQGVTNGEAADRLFVSRHTIDFHLRQIFRKLGISSRVELARMVGERDIDPDDRGSNRHWRRRQARK